MRKRKGGVAIMTVLADGRGGAIPTTAKSVVFFACSYFMLRQPRASLIFVIFFS